MMRVFLFVCAFTAVAAQVGSSWPDRPLTKEVTLDQHYEHHARMLAETDAADTSKPTDDEIAMFQIIACSSIGFVIISYFAMAALFNMEYQNDSLLYSKSKGD
eukprot:CAMPEP_0181203372 /NCGR_PEP_ID=MMETSP1096-20121128/19348_1 /TAXON_ID=156174 ORGANISM="Chrysochromulina ericina, Strain CCMP281" /NCGR_SAMPLE_ID=MMETSP1096 /ASSEMBLY_ACC=CAM_ASM_000453 /LENGTH=102 /DNA_ID=CAMNT_0023293963 /DNA_START=30 /DNA_END=338 /DNA_ORIENTATION=-